MVPGMTIDTGDTAWVLISAALVLFMTPGLAFFYGGMVRSRHVLGMLMQNIFSMGIISVLWSAVGYSLAFGGEGSLIGDFSHVFLADTSGTSGSIPTLAFVAARSGIPPAVPYPPGAPGVPVGGLGPTLRVPKVPLRDPLGPNLG